MSAFIVNKAHIDALVTAAVHGALDAEGRNHSLPFRWGRKASVETRTPEQIGMMLRDENIRSVDTRYCDDPTMLSGWTAEPYLWSRVPLPGLVLLKAIDCYEYQSCETSDWRSTEAHAFCDSLRRRIVSELPGYDAAPWELTEDIVRGLGGARDRPPRR